MVPFVVVLISLSENVSLALLIKVNLAKSGSVFKSLIPSLELLEHCIVKVPSPNFSESLFGVSFEISQVILSYEI